VQIIVIARLFDFLRLAFEHGGKGTLFFSVFGFVCHIITSIKVNPAGLPP
jgi:hypothetical protein